MRQLVAAIISAIILTAGLCLAADQPEAVKNLDISGLPFLGPENAPVTIVVFTDYL
ncbi:MAG: hypothetical protein HYS23_12930 [Geobacter sp.]|nr:hypothetical protein [Geobacter sp.]